MTVGYVRLPRGYDYSVLETEVKGQEVYMRHDSGTGAVPAASLPIVGTTAMKDAEGNAIASCLCRSSSTKYIDDDVSSPQITYFFSTKKGSDAGSDLPPKGTWRMDAGVETVGIGMGKLKEPTLTFKQDSNSFVGESVTITIPVFSFTLPNKITSDVSTYMTQLIACLGKINSDVMNSQALASFQVGSILFNSVSGGTSFNALGALMWTFECHFSVRVIPDYTPSGSEAKNGTWNAMWDPKNLRWDVVTNSGADTFRIYSTADLRYFESAGD